MTEGRTIPLPTEAQRALREAALRRWWLALNEKSAENAAIDKLLRDAGVTQAMIDDYVSGEWRSRYDD